MEVPVSIKDERLKVKVLFLTPWYPSEKDAMSGLFVQKHVEAVRAQGVDVRVIFSQTWRDTWRQWKALQREGWKPDLVQLNVIQKQGLLALWLKRRFGIPYVIIEHWSGYLPENGTYMQLSRFQRTFYQQIAAQASMILTVSDRHAQAMQDCGIRNALWGRINNVVDDFFYEKSDRIQKDTNISGSIEKKTLLHVSCFDERAKNVKSLLRAAKMLSEQRQDWRLVLVGTGVDYEEVCSYAQTLSIPEGLLEWTGELTPHEVAATFDQADAFVLSSRYENAPVVISESLAKGVPVIATRVGGIPEMVNEQCGILVSPDKDQELAEAMDTMLDHFQEYDRETIRKEGEKYSFAAVGKDFKKIYEQVRMD